MKHVRFNPTTSIRLHRGGGGTTSGGGTKWLTDEDYKKIRRGIKKTVQTIVRTDRALDETAMTLRGIEHLRSAEILEQQVSAKNRAIGAVLREQERQTSAKTAIDAARISNIYMLHSRGARQSALERAASDEAFVLANNSRGRRGDSRAATGTTRPTIDGEQTPSVLSTQHHIAHLELSLTIELGSDDQPSAANHNSARGGSSRSRSASPRSAEVMHAPSPLQQDSEERSRRPSLSTWLRHQDSRDLSRSGGKDATEPSHPLTTTGTWAV